MRKRRGDVHVYDVALCGDTIRNVAVGLGLVEHSWHKGLKHLYFVLLGK